jgi:hypothetical protein
MWKAVRLAGLAVATTLLASCSPGAGGSTIGLAAKLLWGLADGQRLMIYGMGIGKVRQIDAANYEFDIVPDGKVSFTFTEPSPCHVDMLMHVSTKYGTTPGTTVSADFSKLSRIEVQDETSGSGADIGKQTGLNVVWVKFAAGDFMKPSLPLGYLFTSLTAADYKAAADDLQRIC